MTQNKFFNGLSSSLKTVVRGGKITWVRLREQEDRFPKTFLAGKWFLAVLTAYLLTWGTVKLTNVAAQAEAKKEFVERLYWAERTQRGPGGEMIVFVIPAISGDLMTKQNEVMVLKPSEIGARSLEELPAALHGPGEYWKKDPTRSEDLTDRLFVKEPEDPFDQFFVHWLRIPLQPLEREKHLRDGLGYGELLSSSDQSEHEALLRHFGNVYGELMRPFPCRLIRWINGWVQVMAFFTFWLALLIVCWKFAVARWEWVRATKWNGKGFFPFSEVLARGELITWTSRPDESVLPKTKIEEELNNLYSSGLGNNPGIAVLMLREVYEAYLRVDPNDQNYRGSAAASLALEQATARYLRKVESDMAPLVYLGWALPSLGFIGTVLGLGTALLSAGDMVTPVSELQRDAIQTVSIYLGRAFDKTFVALLLSLIVIALVYAVRWAQETVIHKMQEQIVRGAIPRLKN